MSDSPLLRRFLLPGNVVSMREDGVDIQGCGGLDSFFVTSIPYLLRGMPRGLGLTINTLSGRLHIAEEALADTQYGGEWTVVDGCRVSAPFATRHGAERLRNAVKLSAPDSAVMRTAYL